MRDSTCGEVGGCSGGEKKKGKKCIYGDGGGGFYPDHPLLLFIRKGPRA